MPVSGGQKIRGRLMWQQKRHVTGLSGCRLICHEGTDPLTARQHWLGGREQFHSHREHIVANPSILILAGDGIGPEVMSEVRKVIDWFGAKRKIKFNVSEDLVAALPTMFTAFR